ncbi:MAG: nitroreductase [Thaumarchaeota archaeon 13_1_40CM_2_39_4]|nr:MAG: nitroreductase [Thaumarchaeota archaeon 13_1_40CM_3_38_6]OLD40462.1 MAG: nitroreductase [Thaumarchaeota archaeon 13_1_40CM_2_39_4]
MLDPEIEKTRKSAYGVNHMILNRWSPRSFSGEDIGDQDLFTLFEAARWAPSSYNNQPWRFIYAKRNSKHWDTILNLLVDFNKQWCANASALVVIISKKTFDYNGKPSVTHQFDSGAAWENLALQATSQGLITHAMQGFDYERARKDLAIPDEYDVMAMVAIGKKGTTEKLLPELQQREAPSDRKPLSEIVMEGKFANKAGS